MKNTNDPIFSEGYVRKKEAMLRCLRKAEKTEVSVSIGRPARILLSAAVICVMLTVTAFAAVKMGVFSISREETKTVVQIGNTDNVTEDVVTKDSYNQITFLSEHEEKGEIPSLIFHRDYMPSEAEESMEGGEIKYGDYDKGTSLSFNVVYLGGEGFTLNLGADADVEEFEANGHSALLISRGETLHFNKILTVYFEDEDVLAMCYAGYGISVDEMKNIAEGLWLEETEDATLAYSIVHNYGAVTLGETLSHQPAYQPLKTAEKITFGHKLIFSDTSFRGDGSDDYTAVSADIEVTPVDISILDDALKLDSGRLKEEFPEYIDELGGFISYPRTELVKNGGAIGDGFGETELVRKKLVLVELKLKNTSDIPVWTYAVGDIQLHLGDEENLIISYVYDNTPQKYSTTSVIAYYDAGGEGKSFYKTGLEAGEEITCHIGFLVDEDMLDEAYVLFGKVNGERYYLKITE